MPLVDQLEPKTGDIHALRIDRNRPSRRPSRGSGRKVLIIAAVVLVVGVAAFVLVRLKFGANLGLAGREVTVAAATRRGPAGPQPLLTASGYVIARHQVEVGSKITGRVTTLEIKEGDPVKKGQVIARLDNYEVSAQLNQAQANLAAAKARLAELEAGSRPQEIDRSRAELARTEADRRNAALNLKRVEQLVKQGVVDQKSLDDARARDEMAEAEYRAAKENYELARIGPRQEAIEAARAQVRQAQAELEYSKAQFENTVITAPVSGTILDRYVDLGEMVTTGFTSDRGAKQALVAIADLRDLQVELDVTESEIAKVKIGQPASITPDAYSDRRYNGEVEYISAVADRQKATIKVKVKVLNPDEYLRPDMGAKVTYYEKGVEVPQERAVVLVPKSSLVQQGSGPAVFLARDGKAVVQQVTAGKEESGYVEILSGLQGGESVIVSGNGDLKDGESIKVKQ